MQWLIEIAINALIVLGVAYLSPKIDVKNFAAALLVAFLIGILNPTVGWILRGIGNIATLGIVALLGLGFIIRILVSAVIIKIVDALVGGFKVRGFGAALLMAVILAVASTLLDYLLWGNS